MNDLGWWESIALGIVQGLTEFLPVSSDGHLVLARHILNYQKDILVFDVLLHLGTLGSLLVFYRKEWIELLQNSICLTIRACKSPRNAKQLLFSDQYRWTSYILITTFVTGIIGLAAEDFVEESFRSLKAASIGLLITSLFLFAGSYLRHGLKKITDNKLGFPIGIGLAQALALLPGVSRSGSTISYALINGVEKEEAGRYSFVAAIPIIFLASVYQSRHLVSVPLEEFWVMSVGILSSFIVGLFALRLLIWMLRQKSLYPFAIYTLLVGLIGFVASYG